MRLELFTHLHGNGAVADVRCGGGVLAILNKSQGRVHGQMVVGEIEELHQTSLMEATDVLLSQMSETNHHRALLEFLQQILHHIQGATR